MTKPPRAQPENRKPRLPEPEGKRPLRGNSDGIGAGLIERAARELVSAYGPAAIALMEKRTRAVRRRGDAESATLWRELAKAVEARLTMGAPGRFERSG